MLYGGFLGSNGLEELPLVITVVTLSPSQNPSQKLAHSFMSIHIPSTSAKSLIKVDSYIMKKE